MTGFLEETAKKYRKNIALTQGERRISYGELPALTGKAAAFSEAGVEKGGRVGLMFPNCPEYVIGFFGALSIGATDTQVNPLYVRRELEHIFDDSGSETVITHAMTYGKVKDVQMRTPLKRVICVGEPECGPEDGYSTFDDIIETASGGAPEVDIDPRRAAVSIQYTGGTTGVSKGAMLTHANLLGGVRQTMDLLVEDASDFPENGKVVAVAPFSTLRGPRRRWAQGR